MTQEQLISLLQQAGCSEDIITHSKKVLKIALKIADRIEKKGIPLDKDIITTGALLHDIGRSRTHGIHHALEGAHIARTLGFPDTITSLIENHIGAGIEKKEAIQLGLPPKDYIPQTLEEEIVAHADNLSETPHIEDIIQEFKNRGHHTGTHRLKKLHQKLEQICDTNLTELL